MKQIKINWDEYETALLIDLFWRIEKEPSKKEEYISNFSRELRNRAKNLNIEIDEFYRNENGIAMQLTSIGHCFYPDRPTLTVSTMFDRIAKMYQNDKITYDNLLKEAMNQIQSSNNHEEKSKETEKLKNLNDVLSTIDKYFSEVTKLFNQQDNNEENQSSLSNFFVDEKLIKNNDDLLNNVLGILNETKTGLKAKTIAKKLRVNKNVINSILYKNKNKVFEIDSNYYWHIKKKKDSNTEEILQTIVNHFPYGIRIDSQIELLRFTQFFIQDNKKNIPLLEEELVKIIKEECIEYNDKYYYLKENEKDSIKKTIIFNINKGLSLFYYDELLKQNEIWMFDYNIVDSSMLKEIMIYLFPSFLYKKNYFYTGKEKNNEISLIDKEIKGVWGNRIIQTVEELNSRLKFIPEEKIKNVLCVNKDFIWNSFETYVNKEKIKINDSKISEIKEQAIEIANENDSVSFSELPIMDIANEYDELSETALFDYLYTFMSDVFTRNGKVLYFKDNIKNTEEIIKYYCTNHTICSVDELKDLIASTQGEVRMPLLIDTVSQYMVRVDKKMFVSDSLVSFDVQKIDNSLESIIHGEGIGLKEITTFASFPYCNYQWNLFLLESYCRRFSKKFKYSCITPNSQNCGAILKKTCSLSYKEFMSLAIAKSNTDLTENNVYNYLFATGLIARRSINDVDELINDAKEIREKGE